jgi:Pyrimidine dimer DNA glycosylase
MNIFYLDSDVVQCARFHSDKHVIKMLLESAQILCSVLWIHHIEAPYKPTHLNHPCVLWANESLSNWLWLKQLAHALNEEYQYRFNRDNHKSYEVIAKLPIPPIPDYGLTKRPQVLPDTCKQEDPVKAYRQYYRTQKRHLGHWTKRDIPDWF